MTNLSATFPTPFAALVEARRLAGFVEDKDFIPVYASSKIKILPYQIAAARFALRSHYLKGCVLCDEGSLGKTYEALLVVAQRWYEGQERILIVLPKNLMKQWQEKLANEFTLPVILWKDFEDNGKGICLITYDEAVKNAERLGQISWQLAVFDEADFLFKPENKSVIALKKALPDAFKLLLTPTPMTMSIMDIYGLIHFIDETLLPDADSFYKRYFRKPENYGELSEWVSQFAFRTLKKQASQYVNFTNRLPVVLNYPLTDDEKKLYEMVDKYLLIPNKSAYPQMDVYQLTLQFYHTLSSSAQAFSALLKAPIERAIGDEKVILQTMKRLADGISISGKMNELANALKKVLTHLKTNKENQKALVFVDNLLTVEVLEAFLKEKGFSVITHKIPDALEQFRRDNTIQILLANDEVAKGLDIEFCPVVVNYDLLYNTVEMEQRICRCHRQGQNSDVLVLNFLSKENFSDVRILELINKRTLQFQGIFGMSDDIVGNFDVSLDDVLNTRRSAESIKDAFSKELELKRPINEELVQKSEQTLFTTFTKEVADKISVSPKYIEEKAEELNSDLWKVVKYYFEVNHPEYIINEEKKTLTLKEGQTPPMMFYYSNGTRNVPYTAQKAYGMAKDFKPAYGRITFTSVLVRGILNEIACPLGGVIQTGNTPSATIEFLYTTVYKKQSGWLRSYKAHYDVLIGKTADGQTLSEEECRQILMRPVKEYQTEGETKPYWVQSSSGFNIPDRALSEAILNRYKTEAQSSFNEDIGLIKLKANRQKNKLEQALTEVRAEVKALKSTSANATDRLEELKVKKQLTTLEQALKSKEENLFIDQIKIDASAEQEIAFLSGTNDLNVEQSVVFKVKL